MVRLCVGRRLPTRITAAAGPGAPPPRHIPTLPKAAVGEARFITNQTVLYGRTPQSDFMRKRKETSGDKERCQCKTDTAYQKSGPQA